LALLPSQANAAAPAYLPGTAVLWLLLIVAMPFATFAVPGEGKTARFFGFLVLAIFSAIASVYLAFAIGPHTSDGFAQFIALLVVTAPYGWIAVLCARSQKTAEQASQDAASSADHSSRQA
jgi:hypothetical protein